MKKIVSLFIVVTLMFSCGEKIEDSSLKELNKQKSSLLNKIDSLNKDLKHIEKQISKLDTNKKLQIVTSLPVKKGLFKHYLEIQGIVQVDKNIEIRPELGGIIKAVFVKEGQRVKAGHILIQLDDTEIKNAIDELSTLLALAKATFERQERLWKQKIGSEIQYLQTKTQKERLDNNLARLKTQARKMKISAPFSGIIDEIFLKTGELTNPQTPVVRLINLDKVYVEADVTETYLPVIKIGTEVIVNFPSINKEIKSKIALIGNYINPNNRSFRTQINLLNKDQSIKPNLLANLKILDFEATGLIIPSTLVQQDQNGNDYVYIITSVNNENKIVKKLISIEKEYNHEVFVSVGLTENDILVNAGTRLVKAGDIVKINNN